MKNLFFLFALVLLGLECSAQRRPVLPYGIYSSSDILKFTFGASSKSAEFRKYIVEKLRHLLKDTLNFSQNNLQWAFAHISSEEISLEEGQYQNSGWNPTSQKIEFFPGHKWTGFVAVFRCGSYACVLYKEDCGNILDVPLETEKDNKVVADDNDQTNPVAIDNNTVITDQNQNSGNVTFGHTFSVRTGGTFIPDPPVLVYGYPQPRPSSIMVVGYGGTSYPGYPGSHIHHGRR